MNARPALLASLLLVAAIATPARGGTLTVEFDFTGSSFTILGGLVQVPPNGAFTAAGATVALPAAGPTTVSPGPASLRSFGFDVTFVFQALPLSFNGRLRLTQNGTAQGTFDTSPSLAVFDQDLLVRQMLTFDCTPSFLCPPPVMSTLPDALGLITFPIAGLSVNGAATIMTTVVVTTNGPTATIMGTFVLSGTEVSRTFVPEPARSVQLAAGLLGLVAIAWRRQRRR